MSSNVTKSAIESENQALKKKLQEIEEMRMKDGRETDDVKASVKAEAELKEDFEKLQKKYDMTRRLCNLRNDDIASLKTQVAQLKEQITQMQSSFQEESEIMTRKYIKVRDLCQMRTNKLNDLRERFGIVVEVATENKDGEQASK